MFMWSVLTRYLIIGLGVTVLLLLAGAGAFVLFFVVLPVFIILFLLRYWKYAASLKQDAAPQEEGPTVIDVEYEIIDKKKK